MPKAPKATDEGYEVVDDPVVTKKVAGPVTAEYITKANALLEEYSLFKREMDTAAKRLLQWDTKNRHKREYELIRVRLLMTYEGAKRMMCNRVRLLCDMNVQHPDFKDGVASLPDTVMTEGPNNIVPSGDTAAERREARRKQQRRTIDLSDETEEEAPVMGMDLGDKDYTTVAGYILRSSPMMNEDTIPRFGPDMMQLLHSGTVTGRVSCRKPNEPESAPLMRAAGLGPVQEQTRIDTINRARSLADMDYASLETRVIGQLIDHLPESLKKALADRPKKLISNRANSVPPAPREDDMDEDASY